MYVINKCFHFITVILSTKPSSFCTPIILNGNLAHDTNLFLFSLFSICCIHYVSQTNQLCCSSAFIRSKHPNIYSHNCMYYYSNIHLLWFHLQAITFDALIYSGDSFILVIYGTLCTGMLCENTWFPDLVQQVQPRNKHYQRDIISH